MSPEEKTFPGMALHAKRTRARRWSQIAKDVDVDEQFKKLLTIIEREISKLLDKSHELEPLETKNHEAVIAYTKTISGLKKQIDESLKNMNPEDVEKIADGDQS